MPRRACKGPVIDQTQVDGAPGAIGMSAEQLGADAQRTATGFRIDRDFRVGESERGRIGLTGPAARRQPVMTPRATEIVAVADPRVIPAALENRSLPV